jgi:hypothetical protein
MPSTSSRPSPARRLPRTTFVIAVAAPHTHRENDCTRRRPKDHEFADNAVSHFIDNDRPIEHLPWSDAARWELWLRWEHWLRWEPWLWWEQRWELGPCAPSRFDKLRRRVGALLAVGALESDNPCAHQRDEARRRVGVLE